MAINFNTTAVKFNLQQKLLVKRWIRLVIERQAKKVGELNFLFAEDEEVLKMNQQFLNHNTFTDIITFENNDGKMINGDIIISVERVEENAKKFDVLFEEELKRVMIHGVLHLLGYKDKSKADMELMREAENQSLSLFTKLAKK